MFIRKIRASFASSPVFCSPNISICSFLPDRHQSCFLGTEAPFLSVSRTPSVRSIFFLHGLVSIKILIQQYGTVKKWVPFTYLKNPLGDVWMDGQTRWDRSRSIVWKFNSNILEFRKLERLKCPKQWFPGAAMLRLWRRGLPCVFSQNKGVSGTRSDRRRPNPRGDQPSPCGASLRRKEPQEIPGSLEIFLRLSGREGCASGPPSAADGLFRLNNSVTKTNYFPFF